LVGSEAAHALLDRLVADGDGGYELVNRSFARDELLSPALALGAAMIACALAARTLDAPARGRRIAAAPYAALPIGVYVAQEHIEVGMAAQRVVWRGRPPDPVRPRRVRPPPAADPRRRAARGPAVAAPPAGGRVRELQYWGLTPFLRRGGRAVVASVRGNALARQPPGRGRVRRGLPGVGLDVPCDPLRRRDDPPFTMMALRCLLGGAILLALSRLRERGSAWPTRHQWAESAVIGSLFFVSCHGLLAREEQHVPSGIAALGLATIPLFVPLLAWALTGSGWRSARTSWALVAGFAGVALLVAAQGSGGGLPAEDAALLLVTALSWAAWGPS
jgi:hypothetical protein